MIRQLLAFLCVAFVLPATFAQPNDPEIAQLYARGLAGDATAVSDCIAALEKVVAAQPNDQVARVYLGSAYTLRSRDLSIGPGKLAALRKGIALMDEAAKTAPANAQVQLTRAVTNEAMPPWYWNTSRRPSPRSSTRVIFTPELRNDSSRRRRARMS